MADIFLSYQRNDRHLAGRVAKALSLEGFSVWWDENLTSREQWDRTIEREIAAAERVIVLWTASSVDSDWVRIEANYARNCQPSKLTQMRFDEANVPIAFSMIQYFDFPRGDFQRSNGWNRFIADLALLKKESWPQLDVAETYIEDSTLVDVDRVFWLFCWGILLYVSIIILLLMKFDTPRAPATFYIAMFFAPLIVGVPNAFASRHERDSKRRMSFFIFAVGLGGIVGLIVGALLILAYALLPRPLGVGDANAALSSLGFFLLVVAVGTSGSQACFAIGRRLGVVYRDAASKVRARNGAIFISIMLAVVLGVATQLTFRRPDMDIVAVAAIALAMFAFAYLLAMQIIPASIATRAGTAGD